MLGGISFLFIALAELAVISYMQRGDRPSKTKNRNEQQSKENFNANCNAKRRLIWLTSNCNGIKNDSPPILEIERQKIPQKIRKPDPPDRKWTPYDIDRIFLISFPSFFLVFNIFYWSYYLGTS